MMSLLLRRESVSHNIFVWEDKIVGWWKLLDVKTLLEGCVIVTDSRGGGWFLSWTLSCPLTSCPTTARSSCSPHHTRESRAGGGAGRAGHQPTFLLLLLASCHSLSTIYYLLSRALLPHRVTVCRTCQSWPLRCLQIQKWQISILFLPFDCLLTMIGEWTFI